MEDPSENKKEKAAAGVAMAGFAVGGPVGLLIGLGGALVVLGVGCLIERTTSNNRHFEQVNRVRFEFNLMDAEIARVRRLIDQLNAQNEVQMETIREYQQVCQNLRVQYGHNQNEYRALLNVVGELEQELNAAVNGTRNRSCVLM